MLRTNAIVKRVSLPPGRRILAVSDIHGNVEFLRGLLEKICFAPDDILFVIGDILEKGPRSLDTLRYLMELSQNHTIYPLRGNCDQITIDFMAHEGWPEEKLWAVLSSWKERGFLMQVAMEADLKLRSASDFPALRELVRTKYARELEYLVSMPVVIETEEYIFVHGGVPREDHLDSLEAHSLMKNDNFMGQGHRFQKWVIVGHWPVTLYHEQIASSKPLVSKEQHIVSIDGANVLKLDGQLNALILPEHPGGGEGFDYAAYDGLPEMRALDPQTASEHSLNIRWSDSEVEILEPGEELTLCRHLSTGRKLWIVSEYLYRRPDGTLHCQDSTDYHLQVEPGDILAVSKQTSQGSLVKKNSVTGWYFGRLEPISSNQQQNTKRTAP